MNAHILDRRLDKMLLRLGKLNNELKLDLKEIEGDLDMLSGRMDRMERRRELVARIVDGDRCRDKGDHNGRDAGACGLDGLKGFDGSSTRELGTDIPLTTTWRRMNNAFLGAASLELSRGVSHVEVGWIRPWLVTSGCEQRWKMHGVPVGYGARKDDVRLPV